MVVFLLKLGLSTFSRSSDVAVELEMRATTGEIGEIFYAAPGETTSGSRTVRFRIGPKYRTYRIALPDNDLGTIRLDPGTSPGTVLIRRMTLRDGAKELKLILGPRVARLTGMKGMQRGAPHRGVLELTATEGDPFMVFAVPAAFVGPRPSMRALGWGVLAAVIFGLADLLATAHLRRRPGLAQSLKAKRDVLRKRMEHPVWPWLTLTLGPVGGLLWARGHTLPTMMCLSLFVALAMAALAGVVAQSWIEGLGMPSSEPRRSPGLFQILWLGQYLVFALAMLISPVTGLFTDLTGIHLPYRLSLPLLVVILALVTLRAARASGGSLAWPTATSAPSTALVLLAVFRAMSMHSVHAASIGHDTQQHVYWAQHMADYGFMALTARGSDLLDDYPKFFHVLSAAWSALGLSTVVGPFLKIMPALQTVFACAFLCELVPSLLDGRAANPVRDRPLLKVTLGAFVAWHMTVGDGQQIYDGNDLSGTPRLAAAWVLLGLPLLYLAQYAGTLRRASPWIVGMIPVFPVVGLGVNPVLVLLYLTYSLPVTILLALLTRERTAVGSPRKWGLHLAAGTLVSALFLLANPFVLNKLAHTRVGAAAIAGAGLRTVVAGLPDPPQHVTPTVLCETPLITCAFDIAVHAAEEGAHGLIASIQNANLPALNGGSYSLFYWLLFAAPLFIAAVRRLAYPGAASQPSRHGSRTFLAILIASAIPAAIYPFVRALLSKFADQNFSFVMLSAYYGSLQMYLGAWLRCLLPLSSWLLLPTSLRGRLTAPGWILAALVGVVGLGNFQIASLVSHRDASWPWTIDWPELRAIRQIDEVVPSHEAVVVPAVHALLYERENLLMSPAPAAVAATQLRSRTLFLVRLGTSLDYGWRDLKERFCGRPEDRRSLLRSANARWVLVRAESPKSEAQLDSDFWQCGVTLRTLEAEFPPAWSERDLALYRINP